jgi:hypothetical protein
MSWMSISSNGTTEVFIPASGWMSATAVTGAKGWGEIRGRNGNLQAIPAVQVTNDVHDPGAVTTACGPTLTTDDVYDPNGVTSVASGSYRFIRAGWLVKLTSGSTLATANIAGVVELIQA